MGKVLKIREIGDPILEKKCKKVDISKGFNGYTLEVIENLKETLAFGTSLGISAPQIGETLRIIVVGAKKENIKYNEAQDIPITVMINPDWEELSDETDIQYEGCSSVPIVRGKVKRYKKIFVSYYDENLNKQEKNIEGFFARLVQHEADHLDGIVFLDKVKGKGSFATTDMIKKYKRK